MVQAVTAAALLVAALTTAGCFGFDFFGGNNVEPSIGNNVSAEAEGKDPATLTEMFTREATGELFTHGTFKATLLDFALLKARIVQRSNKEWWDPNKTKAEIRKLETDNLSFEAYVSGPSKYDGWGKYWKFVLVDSQRRRRAPAVVDGEDTQPGWSQDKDTRVYYNYLTLHFPQYGVYETTKFIKLIGMSPTKDRYELVWNFVR